MTSTSAEQPGFKSVAIIGLGLIGGSLARLIRHQLPQTQIWAFDRDAQTLSQALTDSVIHGTLENLQDPALYTCDLVILATHPHQSADYLQQLVAFAQTPLHIMDLGSSKSAICTLAEKLPQNFSFIGGHPLAGREVSGYANSQWNLFLNKRFLLTPCQKTSESFQKEILAWLTDLGTLPAVMTTQTHDQLMALVSHFPQFYAVALANLLEQHHPQETLMFLGGGIDDQMRLMASSYEMWRDVFYDNRENLDRILSEFITILGQMQHDLREDNLARWFECSHGIHQLYQTHRNTPSSISD